MIDLEAILSLKLNIAILTDDIIAPLYGYDLQQKLQAHLFVFPHGEINKTRETKQMIEDQMLAKGLGKDTCLVALGGGVVSDLGGFIAATYARGIPLILIPTTLMGMVDASIGGKNGVNTPFGKNLIGTIHPPLFTFVEPDFLKSLPQREFKQGLVEMIKHGIIADVNYFDSLKQLTHLDEAIQKSIRIKNTFIQENRRDILNFGHTVGHALEKLSHYSLSHGDAVSIGMVAEAAISKNLGILDQNSFNAIVKILQMHGLPTKLPNVSPKNLIANMALDKKSVQGKPRFTILETVGKTHSFNTLVEESILIQSLC